MSKSAPPTPDYMGAAQATADSSKQVTQSQTYANRPDTNTPWSQQTWQATPTWDPTTNSYVNQWTQSTNLNPNEQASLDAQQGAQKTLSTDAQTMAGNVNTSPLDFSSFTGYGKTPGTADSYANKAASDAFSQYQGRTQPLNDIATQQLDTQLQNSGLKPGDAAYDQQMGLLRKQQSQATTDASLGATQTGATVGAQAYGEDLTSSQFADSQRGQQLSEELQARGFPLSQIQSILSSNQVGIGPQPSFNAAGASSPTNALGATQGMYDASVNNSNVNNANTSGAIGTGVGLVAAFL